MMLVIPCGINEGVVIGENIVVRVLEIDDNCVRLGIKAPNQTPSYWEETIWCEQAETVWELQPH